MKILNKFSDAVIFEDDAPSIKLTVETAVKARANLCRANLGGADLRGANLCRANLRGANLRGADLGGADLGGAYLHGAYLHGANLHGAYLHGADLGGADLGGAYLHGAGLGGANLGGANLRGANLRGANLRGADLRGANGKTIKLVGKRPVLQIGPLGSRADTLLAFVTDDGVWVRAGCFWGSLLDFAAAVDRTHGTNEHAQEYGLAIQMIKLHASLSGVE